MNNLPRKDFLKSHGFSMMDLLVGMAISLLALLAIERAVTLGLNSKRVVSESLDVENSANMAIAQLESEIKSAGYGISMDPFLGCNLQYWNSGAFQTVTLNPVTINAGSGPNGSDVISIAKSLGDTGFAGSNILTNHAANNTNDYIVSNRFNFEVGDQVIIAENGNCARFSVTSLPIGLGLTWSSTNPSNPPAGFTFSVTPSAFALNSGPNGLSIRTYQIDAATNSKIMRDEAFDTGAAQPVAEQIVYMKAFYGKDPLNSMRVTQWDQVTPTTPADWKRVLAIRLAVVARSQAREATEPTGASLTLWPDEKTSTASLSGACWSTTNLTSNKACGPTYSVSAENRHYRHITRTMIIPLRNNIWNNN
jgi:type IV pilus assembly protein PilW